MIKSLIIQKSNLIYLILIVFVFFLCGFYTFSKYAVIEEPIDNIRIELDKNILSLGMPTLYAYMQGEPKVNFQKAYKFKRVNDSIIEINDLKREGITKFRIYFEYIGKDFLLKRINLLSDSKILKTIKLSDISTFDHIEINKNGTFSVTKINGYIESPYILIYNFPYIIIFFTTTLLSILLVFLFKKIEFIEILAETNKREYIFIFYLFSIFSFHPLFNIALIFALAFYIKKFSKERFLENKINILFLLFFLVYFFNSIFVKSNEIRDFSTIERFLPFVFIPILLSSLKPKRPLFFFMMSGLILGFCLFSFSLIDLIVNKNVEYFAFDNFSKYYHPIYVSYLLFLSICYLEQHYNLKHKYFFELILFMLLVFLGSKLVLIISVILFTSFFKNFNTNRKEIISFFLVLTILFIIFKPLQIRFKEVLNFDDLSILKEKKINDSNDSRVNGLTLRLILWRESLATIDGWKEYLFGNGVSKSKSKDLYDRLKKLGLIHHVTYNPHNQFIDTFWRTGLIGLLILLSLFIASLSQGIKNKDHLLIAFSLFMMFSMMTESVFGRVRGIYFFTTVIVLLTNKDLNNENRNIRDSRSAK
ncbi:O-antigen ligase family protein [Abyssalbus ytuae]|uniref:O-antigen ligase family protein n=1 Tax=Abyssalbus ytuae TaxID=2926907 RepID=A0A9E6ZNX1_9FLAO|nr:O-antigen ligase family protein [Abyssalbus ytuae]UOB19424.1 O-antigen ligase family protein [Abyssalbus ytuae]